MSDRLGTAVESRENRITIFIFSLLIFFHGWGATVAWRSNNLPGGEFRQAQTAISAYYIQQENNFSLAYPTPVLGKPWSIPMEFPLYQWVVVWVSDGTGTDLTQSGRAVSLACFYLMLPAVYLLLGHLNVASSRRLVAIGMILTCPLYIYYARAFLIETMALMLSVWFLLAFIHAIEQGNRRWLVLANITGALAGLVKVTTFMLYLLPAGAWGLWILYHSRATLLEPSWRKFLLFIQWIASATCLPFAVTLWWLHFADATKALNPSGAFLISTNLRGFNFGSLGSRFSLEIWSSFWVILKQNLAWPPGLIICGLALVFYGRRWWLRTAICLVIYWGVQMIFPQLYAWHDYYSVANALLLMAAMGFGLIALLESRQSRFLIYGLIGLVYAGQIWLYWGNLYQGQRNISPGGNGLTEALRYVTRSDEVIVVVGEDWSSMIPYYAQRRALMIRNGMQQDQGYITSAFASLKGERIGAIILPQQQPGFSGIISQAVAELGIDPRPVLKWREAYLYLNAETRAHVLKNLRQTNFHEIEWMVGSEPRIDQLKGEWCELVHLRPEQRASFQLMLPRPIRFFSSFGPGLGSRLGRTWYNAHPDTRLRFALAAGPHKLKAEIMLDAGAYDGGLKPQDMTDGVNFDLNLISSNRGVRQLLTRTLDPRNHPADRGPQIIEFSFNLAQAAEVELFIGSGAHGSTARDWALLGPISFD